MTKAEPIGRHVVSTETWNPRAAAPAELINYVDLSSIDSDSKKISQTQQVLGKDAPSRARQLVATSDVLVSTVRPNLNGLTMVPRELDGATASTGFTVLRANEESLSALYLFHWLKTPAFIGDMVKKATGQSYPAVSDRIILESLMPLPEIQEQRRIAAILDHAEALRAKRRQALAKLDTLAQSLFLEMFGDPFSSDSSWPVQTLGEASTFENGDRSSKYPSGDDLVRAGVLFLNGKNIVDDQLDLTSCSYITESKFNSLSRGKAQEWDLIITLRGTLGSCCIFRDAGGSAFINAQMMIIRVGSTLLPQYLHAVLTSQAYKEKFERMSTGVAVPQLTSSQLREVPIIVPPPSEVFDLKPTSEE